MSVYSMTGYASVQHSPLAADGEAPASAAPPRPCIVMLHGLVSHRDHNFAPALAEALHKATGHAVYRFDCRFEPDEAREPGLRIEIRVGDPPFEQLVDVGPVVHQ